MSRSGYSDDCDYDHANLYRANVDRALHGKRGQRFLKEMLAALDALPEKKLITGAMEIDGEVCAIGSVGRLRGTDMTGLDPELYDEWDFATAVAAKFDIARPLAAEIMYENDDGLAYWKTENPEQRFARMRTWVVNHIIDKVD